MEDFFNTTNENINNESESSGDFFSQEPEKETNSYETPINEEFTKPVQKTNEIDTELEELLANKKARIKVIGVGGAGNHTISRISEIGIKGAEIIATNTDAQDLLVCLADKKLLIGKESTQGMGAGNNPEMGEKAARDSEHEIKQILSNSDLVFITAGLGGGTGSGAAPVIAEQSKKLGALTIAVVTVPFTVEGNKRLSNARTALEKLEHIVDTLIIVPNDKLLELAPELPIETAFRIADELLTNAVKGITELVTKSGLINVDFADIKTILGSGGVAMIGVGESDSDNRSIEAVEKAINNPLLEVDITGAKGALINVSGGQDMTLDEAKEVVETVSSKLDKGAEVIWGAQILDDLPGMIRTLLIVTGVKSSQILGRSTTPSDPTKSKIERDLGIDFL